MHVRFESIERCMVGTFDEERLGVGSSPDEFLKMAGGHGGVGPAMHEHDRSAHQRHSLPRSYVIEAKPDRSLHGSKETTLNRPREMAEWRALCHGLTRVGKGGDGYHRVDLIRPGSCQDGRAGSDRMADHADR